MNPGSGIRYKEKRTLKDGEKKMHYFGSPGLGE